MLTTLANVGFELAPYGPYAFGIVATLVLWKWIVGPELATARASSAANLAAAQAALKASENSLQAAELCQQSAANLAALMQKEPHHVRLNRSV